MNFKFFLTLLTIQSLACHQVYIADVGFTVSRAVPVPGKPYFALYDETNTMDTIVDFTDIENGNHSLHTMPNPSEVSSGFTALSSTRIVQVSGQTIWQRTISQTVGGPVLGSAKENLLTYFSGYALGNVKAISSTLRSGTHDICFLHYPSSKSPHLSCVKKTGPSNPFVSTFTSECTSFPNDTSKLGGEIAQDYYYLFRIISFTRTVFRAQIDAGSPTWELVSWPSAVDNGFNFGIKSSTIVKQASGVEKFCVAINYFFRIKIFCTNTDEFEEITLSTSLSSGSSQKVSLAATQDEDKMILVQSSGSSFDIRLIDITQSPVDTSISRDYSHAGISGGAFVVSHTFGNFFLLFSGKSVLIANQYYCYDNGGGLTRSCLACGERDNSNKCTQCVGSEVLDTSGPVVDVLGYDQGVCRASDCTAGQDNCQVCSGDNCTTCDTNYTPDGSGECQLQCSVPQNCTTCSGTATTCTSCSGSYFLEGSTCITNCPAGKYGKTSTNTCESCNGDCKTCQEAGASDCTSCYPGKALHLNQCLLTCPNGFFEQGGVCTQCDSSCASCSGSATTCTSCSGVRFLEASSCLISCPNGKYGETSTNTCDSCNGDCKTCQGPSSSQCTSCFTGKSLHSNQCLSSCPSGFYDNIGICTSCDPSCITCSGSPEACMSCPQDKRLSSSNECIEISEEPETIPEDTPKNTPSEDSLILECGEFDKALTQIMLEFNLPLSTNDKNTDFETLELTIGKAIEDATPIKPEKFEISKSKKKIFIKLKFSEEIEKEFIFIDSKSKLEIHSILPSTPQTPTYFTSYPIKIPISYFSTSLDILISEKGQTSSTVISAFTIILLLGSTHAALILVKLFQLLDYFGYLNIELPKNLKIFLSLFESNLFSFVPNIFHSDESQMGCELHEKLHSLDSHCLLLNNVGEYVMQIMVFIGLKIILVFLYFGSKPSLTNKIGDSKKKNLSHIPTRFHRFIAFVNSYLNMNVCSQLLMSMEVDLYLGGWTNIFTIFRKPNLLNYASLIILIVLTISYIIIVVKIVRIYFQFWRKRAAKSLSEQKEAYFKDKNKGFLGLLEPFRKDSSLSILYLVLIIAKESIFPAVLIFGMTSPYIQIFPMIVFQVILTFFLVFVRPFARKIENIQAILNSVLYLICVLLFLTLHLLQDSIGEEAKYNIIGFPIIGLLIMIIVLNLFYGIFDSIMNIYKKLKRKGGKKRVQASENKEAKRTERAKKASLFSSSSDTEKSIKRLNQQKVKKVKKDKQFLRVESSGNTVIKGINFQLKRKIQVRGFLNRNESIEMSTNEELKLKSRRLNSTTSKFGSYRNIKAQKFAIMQELNEKEAKIMIDKLEDK